MTRRAIRVEARVRNNILWHAIFDTWPSVNAFCGKHGFSPSAVGVLLNLKQSPLTKKGEYRLLCTKLSKIFRVIPEDLFPQKLYEIPRTTGVLEFSFAELPAHGRELAALPAPDDPFKDVVREEMLRAVRDALAPLTEQEKKVIGLRFGLDDDVEHTLEEIGQIVGVTKSGVGAIEKRSLKKMCKFLAKRRKRDWLESGTDPYDIP